MPAPLKNQNARKGPGETVEAVFGPYRCKAGQLKRWRAAAAESRAASFSNWVRLILDRAADREKIPPVEN